MDKLVPHFSSFPKNMKKTELKFLGKALMAFGVMKPDKPKTTPPKFMVPDTTAAYGSYLANTVANCVGCHTDRDLKTGNKPGDEFQLATYAVGLNEMYNIQANKLDYFMVSPNLFGFQFSITFNPNISP